MVLILSSQMGMIHISMYWQLILEMSIELIEYLMLHKVI